MVGPRSSGCRTCVERKVKCDETQPICSRCTKANYACKGYKLDIQFIVMTQTTPRLPRRGRDERAGPSSFHETQSRSDSKRTRTQIYLEKLAASVPEMNADIPSQRTPLRLAASISATSLEDGQLLHAYIKNVKPQLSITKWWLRVLCNSLNEPTINLAVRALAYAYGAITCGGPLVARSRHAYSRTLHSLRRAVAKPLGADRIALQNSILVLSIFEFYNACITKDRKHLTLGELQDCNSEQRTWKYHARGIEQIFKIQGPGFYVCSEDRFVYLAMRDILVLLAYESRTPCFLNDSEWRAVIPEPESVEQTKVAELFGELFAHFVQGPQLLHDAEISLSLGLDTCDIVSNAIALRTEAKRTYQSWWHHLELESTAPTEVPRPGSMPDIVYSFTDVTFADVLTPREICHHNSLMIMINDILRRCGHVDDSLEQESCASALEICKCIPALECMPVTMQGTFALAYLPFFVESACSACPPKYESWLRRKRRGWSVNAE